MEINHNLDEYIDLQKYLLVVKRRWIPATATFLGLLALSVGFGLTQDKIYQAEGQVLIEVDKSSTLTGLDDVNKIGKIESLSLDTNPLATEAEIIGSRPILQKAIQELDLRDDDGDLMKYRDFIENFKVKPIVGTDIAEIAYKNSDPELAAAVVNKIIELYLQQNTLNNNTEAGTANKFIGQQLPLLEANVRKAEAELRRFKNENKISNLKEETTASIDNLSSVESQIGEVSAELQDVNARYQRLQIQLGMTWKEASAVLSLSQSAAVQSALERLQGVKLELAQKRNYFADNTPQIISLKEEETQLTQLLNQQIQNALGASNRSLLSRINIFSLGEIQQAQVEEFAQLGLQKEGLERKLSTLKEIYNSNKQKSNSLPRLQEQQRELERKVEAAQSTYQTLLNKLQETQIAEKQNIRNARVVAEAFVPDKPVGPNIFLIAGAGSMIGALCALAMAFLLDIKDDTIKNSKEAEEIFGYPLQGIVPDFDKIDNSKHFGGDFHLNLPKLAANNISNFSIKEAFQNIQVNLKLQDPDEVYKIIAITSSVPGEGKSSVSANLAVTRSQARKRTLLIDADLRRPTQHDLWELSNDVGLSDVLNGQVEWQDAIENVMPNLDVMTAGTIPDNPIVLLDSKLMTILIQCLSAQYDQIIFDTPPIMAVADTKVLSKIVDKFLFVVRPGVADYASVMGAKKILIGMEPKVLGIVVNAADMKQEAYYGHGKYHYTSKKSKEQAVA